jgi:hypothetical protein
MFRKFTESGGCRGGLVSGMEEAVEEAVEKLWKSCGKAVEKLWKSCGKAVEKLWKSCGNMCWAKPFGPSTSASLEVTFCYHQRIAP